MDNQKMKWWEDKVDEIFMGAFICVITVFALLKIPEQGIAVATAAVSGLCAYLGSRGKENKNGTP